MKKEEYNLSPILKWVGGKRKILSEIKKIFPKNFNKYHELFFGGGALFFDLKPKKACINDLNGELINVYKIIKSNPEELIKLLKTYNNSKEFFYQIRSIDRDFKKFQGMTEIEKASRIIFLNKTCFNGIYRVNSQGQLNSPFGKYVNPKICDEKLIKNISYYFNTNKIEFSSYDFEEHINKIKKGDLVYLDPPYDPITTTSNFTGYQPNGFSRYDQERLKKFCDKIHKKEAFFILSNSKTNFISNLYSEYIIKEIDVKRLINCKGDKRDIVKEVLVRNYE